MVTRKRLATELENMSYRSHIEPKNLTEALNYEFQMLAMQKEFAQFERDNVWGLVPRTKRYECYQNQMDI